MWLFTKYGMFSVVRCSTDPDVLKFRARKREHLEALIKQARLSKDRRIIETTDSDYRFRIILNRTLGLRILDELMADIDYTNFKDAAKKQQGSNNDYVKTLLQVWGLGLTLQHSDHPGRQDGLRQPTRRSVPSPKK